MRARPSVAVVLGLGLAALGGAAQARTFYVVQSGKDAWTVMDAQGVEPVPGTPHRRAWAVTIQRNIHGPGVPPQPGYVRTLSEYDCQASRTRWLSLVAYSRVGTQLVSRENPAPDWGPALDSRETEAAFRVVCYGVGGGSVVAADSIGQVVIGLMQAWDPAPPPAPEPAPKGKDAPVKTPAKKKT